MAGFLPIFCRRRDLRIPASFLLSLSIDGRVERRTNEDAPVGHSSRRCQERRLYNTAGRLESKISRVIRVDRTENPCCGYSSLYMQREVCTAAAVVVGCRSRFATCSSVLCCKQVARCQTGMPPMVLATPSSSLPRVCVGNPFSLNSGRHRLQLSACILRTSGGAQCRYPHSSNKDHSQRVEKGEIGMIPSSRFYSEIFLVLIGAVVAGETSSIKKSDFGGRCSQRIVMMCYK